MAMQIVCPHCEKDYTVADTLLGKQVRCKNCNRLFTAEAAPVEVEEADEEAVVVEEAVGREGAPRKRSLNGAGRSKRPAEEETPRRKGRDRDEEDEADSDAGRARRPRRGCRCGSG